ncbi:MAG: phosphatase PAP2 family protein, partial [Candidatus Aminicenantales bacterium]
ALGVIALVRLGEGTRNKVLDFFRTFYPVGVLLFAWFELDAVIPMFFGTYWATDIIVRLEKTLFGSLPHLWFQQFYRPWLDEVMSFIYAGYYLFLPAVTLTLYLKRKREAALAAFSIGMFTYLTNFALFFIFPTLAPDGSGTRNVSNPASWSGCLVAGVIRFLQSGAASKGATFPSSHISAAFIWSFIALRYERRLGYVLLPLAVGVSVAVVYLGYHYALDPVFGLIWSLICFPVALRILRLRNEDPGRAV